MGQGFNQGVGQVADRLREGYAAATEEFSDRYRRAEGMVARNPSSSVLVGFGLGFGLGLALTAMLGRREETWGEYAQREGRNTFRDLPRHARRLDRKWGVSEKVSELPDTVHSTFHHLADTLRDLPSMIARSMR
jgi:hypothetical protein